MRCVVTAGPTYEPIDRVRRLTNLSTGRLGCRLAAHLTAAGHEVILLLGEQATWTGERQAARIEMFSTTTDLAARLEGLAGEQVDAVFHAAAVSDFAVGQIWERSATGRVLSAQGGKLSTRGSTYLLQLIPTPKLIPVFRDWYPRARLVGWKYEVDGRQAGVLDLARRQIRECRTDACVANGPAYGPGFGLVTLPDRHQPLADEAALLAALEQWLHAPRIPLSS